MRISKNSSSLSIVSNVNLMEGFTGLRIFNNLFGSILVLPKDASDSSRN